MMPENARGMRVLTKLVLGLHASQHDHAHDPWRVQTDARIASIDRKLVGIAITSSLAGLGGIAKLLEVAHTTGLIG